jgi:protein-disulfide isomerase
MHKSCLITLLFGLMFAMLPQTAQSLDENIGQVLSGTMKSPVRIEVFSDFRCAHCRKYFLETIKPLVKFYSAKGQVCVIYYEYPWQTNQYSRQAAQYCEASAKLGRQKLMTVMEALFTDVDLWGKDGNIQRTLAKVLSAQELQTVQKLQQDPAINLAIDKALEFGKTRGVDQTPTSFFHTPQKDQKLTSYIEYGLLRTFIDSVLR